MLFSSTVFLFAFLPMVLFVYYVFFIKHIKAKNVLLLISSLFFYAWGEPRFVLIMMLSIIMNFLFGLLSDKYQGKKSGRLVIATMLCFNLGILFIFKYLAFSLGIINNIGLGNFIIPSITLPIGISFFTFQAISYVIDVYRNEVDVQKNILHVGLYISFFPQLIAGPIVRYKTIAYQIENRKESFSDFSEGVCRFITGLSKKVLIANNIALVADKAFNSPSAELSMAMSWLGALAYALQIFFDFSGYSDMAIGMGKMFGFQFLENFNYPYIAKSISDFWRRWHISLGSWFRDYLYFPLGGSRVEGRLRLVFNLFIVWFLTGLWHGASWNFVLWGLWYFLFIAIEKLSGFEKKWHKLSFLKHIYVLLIVVFGWVLFRASDLTAALTYLKTMFHLDSNLLINDTFRLYLRENIYFFLFGIILSAPVFKWLSEKYRDKIPALYRWGEYLRPLLYIACFILAISFIVKDAYNPFIYFNF